MLKCLIPHADLDHSQYTPHNSKVIILFLIAMSLHNLPEGLSVGISNASTVQDIGPLVSFAIGLQNVPEGFLVAIFLVTQNVSRFNAILFAMLTGIIELSAGFIGIFFGESDRKSTRLN